MKLSEKYLEEKSKNTELALNPYGMCKIYGDLCYWEARKTFLVDNQRFIPQDQYIPQLEEAVSFIQKIAEEHKL